MTTYPEQRQNTTKTERRNGESGLPGAHSASTNSGSVRFSSRSATRWSTNERVEVDIAALVLEAVTDRDGARLLLVLADDDHVREPVVVTGADLATDRPVAVLDLLDAEAGVLQFVFHAVGVAERLVGDGEDADLFGREPQREVAVEVLDEHHEEALVAPVHSARWIITGWWSSLSSPV